MGFPALGGLIVKGDAMKLSKPSDFHTPHLLYDPVRKDALIVHSDQVITLPGPFADYAEADIAMRKALGEPRPARRK